MKKNLSLFLLVLATNFGVGLTQTRMISHLTKQGGGFVTEVIITNLSLSEEEYTLMVYDNNGVLMQTVSSTVPGESTVFSSAESLVGAAASHFVITSSTEITFAVAYRAVGGLSGPAHVLESEAQSRAWRLFPGEDAVTWDGIAVVNRGDAPTSVLLKQLTSTGDITEQKVIIPEMQPNAKGLYVISGNFQNLPQSVFELSADQPLAVMALRGEALSSLFLWENKAFPVAISQPLGNSEISIYVAGESIEAFNHFIARPFNSDGSLNVRGSENNTPDEFGWMVPFADRLNIRDPGLHVKWVGAEEWIDHDWSTSTGTYPSNQPGWTSAVAGSTIRSWLNDRRDELVAKTYCYDMVLAARGGNDLDQGVDETTYKQDLRELIRLLDAGSSCQQHPLIYVTGHMPDQNGWNGGTDATAIDEWIQLQTTRYVTWSMDIVSEFQQSNPEFRIHFIDLFNPFIQGMPTDAFPNETWLDSNGGPDLEKLHRDGSHPKRLASILAGELAANGIGIQDVLDALSQHTKSPTP